MPRRRIFPVLSAIWAVLRPICMALVAAALNRANAMIVCIGLLFGGLDFEKSISIAVLGALDTDCNGATVGSIMGMVLGAKALPSKWIAPLNDRVKSGVDGFGIVKISDLALKTIEIIKKI